MGIHTMQNELILVDQFDTILGYGTHSLVHQGAGLLHRAISVFIINQHDKVLLQQRSVKKLLWPLVWSNSCCGHPYRGENYLEAAERRVWEELHLRPTLRHLFTFSYKATYQNIGSECEICAVFIGCSNCVPEPNPVEIEDLCFIESSLLTKYLRTNQNFFSPWLYLEWAIIIERGYLQP